MPFIFWDIDDTLYNQFDPFKKAFNQIFTFNNIDVEQVFIESRKLSDLKFEDSEKGVISKNDMQIFRIKNSLKKFGYDINNDIAQEFQMEYLNQQSHITLSRNMVNALDFLMKRNIPMGIISNGPSDHQRNKIKTLELKKWIPDENIFISSELNYAKPSLEIYKLAEKIVFNETKKDIYFIGDSYNNDMVGSINAGWTSIWLNKHSFTDINNNFIPKYTVYNDKELLLLLEKIF